MSLAYQELGPNENSVDLSQPNNILGFQYVKASIEQHINIKMMTISRKNAHYHDEDFASSTIASATSIRKALFSPPEDLDTVHSYVPKETSSLLLQYKNSFGAFHHWEMYWDYLRFVILQSDVNELKEIYEIEEGMENRILSSLKSLNPFENLWKLLKRNGIHGLGYKGH